MVTGRYTSAEISVWRSTLDHFDAIKIGLTATPASHTTAYFTNKVYEYPYERAVREGYLVDYDVVNVRSDVRMKGLFLREGENVEIVNAQTGLSTLDTLEDERQYDTAEIERKVTAPESNRKIIEELKKYADEHQQKLGRFPKTLIFAVNDLPHTSHADQLVELARDAFGRGDGFVEKITGRVDRPLQRIREFRNRPNPGIAVTVDLLTTGVDIGVEDMTRYLAGELGLDALLRPPPPLTPLDRAVAMEPGRWMASAVALAHELEQRGLQQSATDWILALDRIQREIRAALPTRWQRIATGIDIVEPPPVEVIDRLPLPEPAPKKLRPEPPTTRSSTRRGTRR